MNLAEETDMAKKTKVPFSFKHKIQKWKSGIKLFIAGLKMMPKDKLIGGIISGFFFLFGIGHFIYYMYLLIRAYHWVGYVLAILLSIPFLLRFSYEIYKGISDYRHHVKMKKIQQKIKEQGIDSSKNILND